MAARKTKQPRKNGKFVSNKSNGNGAKVGDPRSVFNYSPYPEGANGQGEPISDYQIRQMVVNNLLYERRALQRFLDDRRDIDKECGYPQTEELTAIDYKKLYDREPAGARVVNLFPDECWQSIPKIYEDEDLEISTEFEEAFEQLGKLLANDLGPDEDLEEDGFFQDDEINPIWSYLHRVDRLSGIGHYGAILIGTDDGNDLREPLEFNKQERKLTYLRVLDETTCSIAKFVDEPSDRRFGRPESYNVVLGSSNYVSAGRGTVAQERTISEANVHWTRIVHIADCLESSEIIGVPRLKPVYNRVYDLHKVTGGSGEMYWKGAFPGYHFGLDPRLAFLHNKGEFTADLTLFRNQMENFQEGLQRYTFGPGISVNGMPIQVSDPTPQIKAYIEQICILLGCPVRIFLGSERGELSSTQDEGAWDGRIQFRRVNYITTRIIVPFIVRLIRLGILPKPKRFSVSWPSIGEESKAEKADTAVKITDALVKYIQGGVDSLIEPKDYLVRIHGFSEDEVDQVLESRMESMKEEVATGLEDLPDDPGMMGQPIPQEGQAEQKPLNGAQITAAIGVLEKFTLGQLAEVAAEELLRAVGIDETRVNAMIQSSKNVKPPTEEPSQIPGQPPNEQGEQDETEESDEEKEDGEASGSTEEDEEEQTENTFCSTGKGGGIDPTCGKGGKGGVSFTVSEAESIKNYSWTLYRETKDPSSDKAKEQLRDFHSATEKLPNYEGTVHRTIVVDNLKSVEGTSHGLKENSRFWADRPLSASKSKEITEDFGTGAASSKQTIVNFKIKTKTGADISDHVEDDMKFQQEVLIRPGSGFLVRNVKKSKGPHGGNQVDVELEEIYGNPQIKKQYLNKIGVE